MTRRWLRWLLPAALILATLAVVAWLTADEGGGVPFVYTLF